jgi:cob(I)alamin adenosyltransferase
VEAYGTVDELNTCIGMVASQPIDEYTKKILFQIQDKLFVLGSSLAADPEKSKMKLPDIIEQDVTLLENEIDSIENMLPPLQNFILPGGNISASFCHLSRVVCRRAERIVSFLAESNNVPTIIIKYLNRLSDYLFVLSRKLNFDTGTPEILWNSLK